MQKLHRYFPKTIYLYFSKSNRFEVLECEYFEAIYITITRNIQTIHASRVNFKPCALNNAHVSFVPEDNTFHKKAIRY